MSVRLAKILREDRASVFFHASWSGPSSAVFRLLRERLHALSISEDEVRVVDVDIEESAIHRLMDEGFSLHGYGEAAVVRDGKIRYFAVLGRGDESMTSRVDAFLNEHRKA